MTKWLDIIYKCRCMPKERTIQVRERLDDEDIIDFMHHVQNAIGVDHNNLSPRCNATSMEYAKVPVDGDKVGGTRGGTA